MPVFTPGFIPGTSTNPPSPRLGPPFPVISLFLRMVLADITSTFPPLPFTMVSARIFAPGSMLVMAADTVGVTLGPPFARSSVVSIATPLLPWVMPEALIFAVGATATLPVVATSIALPLLFGA